MATQLVTMTPITTEIKITTVMKLMIAVVMVLCVNKIELVAMVATKEAALVLVARNEDIAQNLYPIPRHLALLAVAAGKHAEETNAWSGGITS